jgi:hypothetical protein
MSVKGACNTFDNVLIMLSVFSDSEMKLFSNDEETKNIRFAAASARKYLFLPFCLMRIIATGINTINALIS